MTVWVVTFTIAFLAVVANILLLWRAVGRLEAGRRDQPVKVEVRADGCPGYHLAFLKPGESSQFPPQLLADLRDAQKATVRRHAHPEPES